ncbi:DNA replication regulator sld2 [Favolaschia claudopus]|uniref:DNA replication regulator SLD2 n=1 Tax=Favolaschia claudopus TaxID=2862362 RepID=A0AAW0EGC5_9AGAR
MDVSTLKAEIKAWERSFRANHGREPSVQDIKKQPDLAEKYKLYKKLNKGTERGNSTSTKLSVPPSTPPRTQPRHFGQPSLLLSKPRAVAATQPLSGYNPFSPQKNKGKQKESSPETLPIPFRIPPAAHTLHTSSTFPATTADDPRTGLPVSNKEKRRRVMPQNDNSDEDSDQGVVDSSFVDDSPAKPTNGVRSFKLLFDESAAKPIFPSFSRSKSAPFGLFPESISTIPPADASQDMDVDDAPSISLHKSTPSTLSSSQEDDDPFAEPVKETDTASEEANVLRSEYAPTSLLPPSPPAAPRRVAGNGQNLKGKGKQTKNVGTALGGDESDEDAAINVRETVRLFDRTASRGRVLDKHALDDDALEFTSRHPSDVDIAETTHSDSISLPDRLRSVLSLAPGTSHDEDEKVVIQRLLYGTHRANYDPSKGGEIWGVGELEEEEREEFASGNDTSTKRRVYDDEDDWEGEGVPWEVAEL